MSWTTPRARSSAYSAAHTVLATGGCGAVYLHTSNPRDAIGAGYAMAYGAGARIVNMEYIQFHPTSLFHRDADSFLISETVRGEGARLKTRDGRTFMEKYSDRKDLAPRDEVTRAIYEEMINTNSNYVLLDLASYAKVDITEALPEHLQDLPAATASTSPGSPSPSSRPPTTAAAASWSTAGGGRRSRASTPSARSPARASTAPTGWPRPRSSRAWSGGRGRAGDIAERFDGGAPLKPAEIHEWYYPEARGGDRPGPHQPGLADHPVDDVELRGDHPDDEAARAGQVRPRISPPPDREVLPGGGRWTPRSSA